MLTTVAALCHIFSVCVFPSYQLLVHVTSCLCFSYCSFISILCSYCSFLTISLLGSNHCISILLLFGPCFIAKICIEKNPVALQTCTFYMNSNCLYTFYQCLSQACSFLLSPCCFLTLIMSISFYHLPNSCACSMFVNIFYCCLVNLLLAR